MIRLDRMLMIGSAGANVGKTRLACALIRKFSKTSPVIAIKVTTIRAKDGQCPRGGQGCGVCSSLNGNFRITEETDRNLNKDTARLLKAGAKRVYWLRVMKTHLEKGLTTLLDEIEPDNAIVCESNSLRQVVEPGLFVMVRGRSQSMWKSAARDVKEYADKIVTCDGRCFDFDTERIKLVDRKWAIQQEATAIIIAGGDSTRTGMDKSMLPIRGKPMIRHIYDRLCSHFDQILVSANGASRYSFLDAQIIPDRVTGQGPLMGIASALKASANEVNFVIACDMPEFDMSFVRKMIKQVRDCDAVVPKIGVSQYEPLFAVYKKGALAAIEDALSSGNNRIMDALSDCRVKYIDLTDARRLRNINTMQDYLGFINGESDVDV
jgi:molybdopterin-guanine dinucleotide biosynthesis protein A